MSWYEYRPVATEVDDSIEHQYKDAQPTKRTLRAKVKKTYFKTKQSIIEKIGKRQDQFVVDGDADVDARLEVKNYWFVCSVFLFVCLTVCLCVCPSVRPSVCLSVCLCLSLSNCFKIEWLISFLL